MHILEMKEESYQENSIENMTDTFHHNFQENFSWSPALCFQELGSINQKSNQNATIKAVT